MRLLANENIPLKMVLRLREAGHDVKGISETNPGITNTVVLGLAQREQRALLTFDRDYGELVYLKRLPCPPGILYLRFVPTSPEEALQFVAPLLGDDGNRVTGYFVVVDRESYRRRPMPETVE